MWAKVKAFLILVKNDLGDSWQRSKIFVFAIAGLILALEFKKLKEFLLVYEGQQEIKNDDKKDQALATQENQDNQQADALVKTAQQLPAQETPVSDDWNKK